MTGKRIAFQDNLNGLIQCIAAEPSISGLTTLIMVDREATEVHVGRSGWHNENCEDCVASGVE